MVLVAARRLTLEGTAARIVGALRVTGVHCVLLKGPTLSDSTTAFGPTTTSTS